MGKKILENHTGLCVICSLNDVTLRTQAIVGFCIHTVSSYKGAPSSGCDKITLNIKGNVLCSLGILATAFWLLLKVLPMFAKNKNDIYIIALRIRASLFKKHLYIKFFFSPTEMYV